MTIKTFFKQNYDLMMSYLEAQPTNKNFSNKIYTKCNREITITDDKTKKQHILRMRSENNGMSQFNVIYSKSRPDSFYDIEMKDIRVETNFLKDKLTIFANKTSALVKSDILIFGDEVTTYLSEGPHSWLEDEKYYKIIEANFPFGKKVIYEYKVSNLIKDGKIVQLLRHPDKSLMTIYKGEIDSNPNIDYKKLNTYDDKEYFQINKLFIQCDKKQAYPVFFTYYGCRYTNNMGTIPNIANQVAQILSGNPDAIAPTYIINKLYRCLRETEKRRVAVPAIFELSDDIAERLRNNINFDADTLYGNKFIVFLSKQENFDVIENKKVNKTDDIVQYRKDNAGKYAGKYNTKKKIVMYLKRHNNDFNPKWSDEEKYIALSLLSKNSEAVPSFSSINK